MSTKSRDQAENSCARQSKLDALLRNSINDNKTRPEKTVKQPGTRLDFAKPHRMKQDSTALPQIHNINGSETVKTARKEVLQVQQAYQGNQTHTRV